MRWVVFDIVVGAALVWLVWDARPVDMPVPEKVAVASPAPPPEVLPPAVPPPVAAEPADVPDPPMPPAPAIDRGQRLRALARDAEAMFLRGGE